MSSKVVCRECSLPNLFSRIFENLLVFVNVILGMKGNSKVSTSYYIDSLFTVYFLYKYNKILEKVFIIKKCLFQYLCEYTVR